MSEFNSALFESGELMKRGARAIVENVGKTVALLTLLAAALVLFCEVSLSDLKGERFTTTLLVMLIASYLMYFSMHDTGRESGRRCDEYKCASERFKSLASRIEGRDLPALRTFLTSYASDEARYERGAILLRGGYSYEEYEAYKNGGACDKKARRVFRKADKVKAVAPSPTALIESGAEKRRRGMRDPESTRLLCSFLRLLPMTACSLFTVSVMLTAKDGMNAADAIEAVIKIASLIIVGLRGYLAGYRYERVTVPLWLESRSRLLDAFLKEKSEGDGK